MTITKSEIVNRLSQTLGLNKREGKELVEHFFEEILAALETGECVKLSGFGNFNLRDKSQRPGRNPRTGKHVPVRPRRVVTFRAGQKLKAKIEQHAGPEIQDE